MGEIFFKIEKILFFSMLACCAGKRVNIRKTKHFAGAKNWPKGGSQYKPLLLLLFTALQLLPLSLLTGLSAFLCQEASRLLWVICTCHGLC